MLGSPFKDVLVLYRASLIPGIPALLWDPGLPSRMCSRLSPLLPLLGQVAIPDPTWLVLHCGYLGYGIDMTADLNEKALQIGTHYTDLKSQWLRNLP